jgi:tripartite ATP-independent transporter DctM subunit
MIREAQATSDQIEASRGGQPSWAGALKSAENAVVSVALLAMVAIPLAESVLRRVFHTGIPASTSIVQHLVLVVGMLGGAIAAREGRLLSLSTLGETSLHGSLKSVSRFFTSSVSAAISGFLCVAAYQFVQTEQGAGKILAYGIPVWVVEWVLPLGFGAIAIRILLHTSAKWGTRAAATAFAILLAAVATRWPGGFHHLVPIALGTLFVISLLGAPAFVTLGGATLILFASADQPIAAIPVAHYMLVTNPTLPTLPLFTLAGYFLAEGGSPKRLIRVFYALFGQFRGGPAIVTVLVCAFFTSFTGASGVTILALGGLLKPVLDAAGYSEKNVLGLLTGSGSLGLLLPPCLPLIFYAIVAKVPIEQMFLASIIPAFVMIAATAIWGVRQGRANNANVRNFDWLEARAAVSEAKWELAMPVVACVALFSGLATPVEAAALTALYAFLIETVVHRDLKILQDVPRVTAECGLLIGGVLLILGVSLGLTNYLVDAEVPTRAVEWTTQSIHSPVLFLLLLNVFLLVVGCLMEIYPAIVVEVPLLVPLGAAFGIDPVRLGIIFLANMELGYLTPPVGLNLLMSSFRFGKSVPEVLRAVLPVVVVLSAGVLLITYVPALTTALPKLFGY